jgi:hypothetical protein
MKNMQFKVVGDTFIVVYGARNPTNEEWEEYLAEVERQGFERTVQLIVTEGGGPDSTQRKLLNEKLKGRSVPVAVISKNPIIRGVVTALSWFNTKIRAFVPSNFADALRHLGIREAEGKTLEREVNELRIGLDLPPLQLLP